MTGNPLDSWRGRPSDRFTVLVCGSVQCNGATTTHTIERSDGSKRVARGLRTFTCVRCGSVKTVAQSNGNTGSEERP